MLILPNCTIPIKLTLNRSTLLPSSKCIIVKNTKSGNYDLSLFSESDFGVGISLRGKQFSIYSENLNKVPDADTCVLGFSNFDVSIREVNLFTIEFIYSQKTALSLQQEQEQSNFTDLNSYCCECYIKGKRNMTKFVQFLGIVQPKISDYKTYDNTYKIKDNHYGNLFVLTKKYILSHLNKPILVCGGQGVETDTKGHSAYVLVVSELRNNTVFGKMYHSISYNSSSDFEWERGELEIFTFNGPFLVFGSDYEPIYLIYKINPKYKKILASNFAKIMKMT
jgi:hypothetical protein